LIATITFGILHAGEMLDRAGDADGDIELRRHTLPVCPTCQSFGALGRRPPARAMRRRRRLTCSAKRLDILCEVLAALHGAAAGDDDFLRMSVSGDRFWRLPHRQNSRGRDHQPMLRSRPRRCPSPAAAKVEVRTVDDLFGVLRLHGLDRVAGVDRPLERVGETTLMISETCITSSRAADAPHHILETEVAGATNAS